jgi:putative transposase
VPHPEQSEGWDYHNIAIQPGTSAKYSLAMPNGLIRIQQSGHLHFLTFSCHQRSAKLGTDADKDTFCEALEEIRLRWEFRMVGYVVMPEHVHLLLSEPKKGRLSVAVQMLKQTVSRELGIRSEPFWTPRYYDFNVYSAEKTGEKLAYMHFNPVKRGLVYEEIDWRWSSARFYKGLNPGPVALEGSTRIQSSEHHTEGAPS